LAVTEKNRFWSTLIAIVLGAAIISSGAYYLFRASGKSSPTATGQKPEKPALPRMANLPPKKAAIEPPPPPSYQPDAPLLEQARDQLRDGIAPDDAVALASSLPESPERADAAFLLLEYAADSGNALAAELVGSYYDPTAETPSGTIRKNPETAYDWYQKAADGGQDTELQLKRLRRWVEEQAEQGSREARLLLNNWH
jgi:TPR repeat protein